MSYGKMSVSGIYTFKYIDPRNFFIELVDCDYINLLDTFNNPKYYFLSYETFRKIPRKVISKFPDNDKYDCNHKSYAGLLKKYDDDLLYNKNRIVILGLLNKYGLLNSFNENNDFELIKMFLNIKGLSKREKIIMTNAYNMYINSVKKYAFKTLNEYCVLNVKNHIDYRNLKTILKKCIIEQEFFPINIGFSIRIFVASLTDGMFHRNSSINSLNYCAVYKKYHLVKLLSRMTEYMHPPTIRGSSMEWAISRNDIIAISMLNTQVTNYVFTRFDNTLTFKDMNRKTAEFVIREVEAFRHYIATIKEELKYDYKTKDYIYDKLYIFFKYEVKTLEDLKKHIDQLKSMGDILDVEKLNPIHWFIIKFAKVPVFDTEEQTNIYKRELNDILEQLLKDHYFIDSFNPLILAIDLHAFHLVDTLFKHFGEWLRLSDIENISEYLTSNITLAKQFLKETKSDFIYGHRSLKERAVKRNKVWRELIGDYQEEYTSIYNDIFKTPKVHETKMSNSIYDKIFKITKVHETKISKDVFGEDDHLMQSTEEQKELKKMIESSYQKLNNRFNQKIEKEEENRSLKQRIWNKVSNVFSGFI